MDITELFTPEEIAERQASKLASERQSLTDQISVKEAELSSLREQLAVITPEETTETPAEEAGEPADHAEGAPEA